MSKTAADAGRGAQAGKVSKAAPAIERRPLPMIEVEGEKHVVCFVNPAFCRLLRKTREELIGQPFAAIVANGAACVSLLDRVARTGSGDATAESDRADSGPAYWLYADWPAANAGEPTQRVVIQLTKAAHSHQTVAAMNEALLVSALHQHELRYVAEKANARLEIEIVERKIADTALRAANVDLELAQRAGEQAGQAKDNFLAALSHELRTPLTPVLMTAAALREDERLPLDVRVQLGMMERNVVLEARLIDDLLDLTRITHGKLQLRTQRCDAQRLIEYAMEIVGEEARVKDIAIETTFSARRRELSGDPTRLQQVFWNLLSNAVKFTPVGGTVFVRTRNVTVTPDESWLHVEVTDTGSGIDPAQLERIFMPFEQGGATEVNRFGGLGLGLSIARAVVEMHGGRISARSGGARCGATFLVELPGAVSPPPEEAAEAALGSGGAWVASAAPARSAPLRLLVVEDHKPTLDALSRLLERDGHTVSTASSAATALDVAAVKAFDCVISDIGLPDASGLELMGKLRDRHGLQGIALSGFGMEEDLARSREAGFVAHLVKPVAISDLRRVIAAVRCQPTK